MAAKPDPADHPAGLQQRLDGLESRLRTRSARRGGTERGSLETEVAGILGMIERPAVIRDPAGGIVHANDAAARSVGRRSGGDLLGASADALFPPGGRIRVTPVEWCGARCEAVVVEDPAGGNAGYGRRLAEAEERLAEAERRLVDVVTHTSDGFLLWDADDRLIMFNDHFHLPPAECPELFRRGMTFREFAQGRVRRHWYEGHHAESAEAALAERERIHREAAGSQEICLDGDRWVLMTERRTADGFTIGIYTDITERKRHEKALADAERRYRELVESHPDAILIAAESGLVLANRAAKRMFSADDRQPLVGRSPREIVAPESWPELGAAIEAARSHARRTELHGVQICLPDGRRLSAEGEVAPFTWGEEPVQILFLRDISERIAAEQRNALLATVLDQAPDAVVVADRRFRIEHVNPAFERMSGRSGAEIVGGPADAYLLPADGEDAEAFRRGVRTVLERHEVWNGRARVPSADGSFVEVEALISPVSDRSGTVSHYLAIKRDVAERLRAERAMREAKEAAELANRAKSEFLANMSHELRTPLNAVIGLSEVLKDEMYGPLGNDRYRGYARDIRDSGRHLLRLINDILDISGIDAGTLSPQPELFDLGEAIETAVRITRGRRGSRNTRITADVAPGLGPIRLDERMFKQILSNLLSNASKFTPEGGRIELTARRWRRDGIEVTIRDTGIGIAKDHVGKIFAPFVQLETAFDRRYEGAGLGLPLTKALVDLQGGELEIESALGEGTTVTVRLPSTPAEPG